MKPGMQGVLDVLRGQTGFRIINNNEWHAAFNLAEEEKVLPLFLSRLAQSGTELSEELQTRIKESQRNAAIEGFFWQSELKSLLRAFAAAAIPVIPLKGPFFAQRVYGAVAMRRCHDLDILVHRNDIARAAAVLTSLGCVQFERRDDYDLKWLHGSSKIELHFDVANPLEFNFDMDTAWKRATLDTFAGEPAWKMSADDELLFLCLHGVRHRFERLGYIADISLAAAATHNEAGPQIHLRPKVTDLTSLLLLGLALAKRFDPEHDITFQITHTRKQHEAMEQLATELWETVLNHTAFRPGWWSLHRFFLRMEPRPLHKLMKRAVHLYVLATRLIEADVAFAAKWGFHRTWQAWLLRPIRLVIQRMQRP
jgi:hypothetical protein